jgi:hypothetical protein
MKHPENRYIVYYNTVSDDIYSIENVNILDTKKNRILVLRDSDTVAFENSPNETDKDVIETIQALGYSERDFK